MSENDDNFVRSLSDNFSTQLLDYYDGKCQYYLCQWQGYKYHYPSSLGDTAPKSVICCNAHIFNFGFCYRCEKFARADRHFRINRGRLCDECYENLYSKPYFGHIDDPMVDIDDLDY